MMASYDFSDDDEESLVSDSQGYVNVFTDGGCKRYKNGTILSSIGVFFGHGHVQNVSRIAPCIHDNNLAEATAVLEALNIAQKCNFKKVRIYTDSQSTIDIVKSSKVKSIYRLKKVKKMDSKDRPKGIKLYLKATSIFDKIFDHIDKLEDFQLIWVKGHSTSGFFGHDGNKEADKLASRALRVAAAAASLKENKHRIKGKRTSKIHFPK